MNKYLGKNDSLNLSKEYSRLNEILITFNWRISECDKKKYLNPFYNLDIDSSAFMLGKNGKAPSSNEVIYFGQNAHESGCIKLIEDYEICKTAIKVDLLKIPSNIDKIVFAVSINDAMNKEQSFAFLNSLCFKVINPSTGSFLANHEIFEDEPFHDALILGELYRDNKEWIFKAIGSGYTNGLQGLINRYL